MGKSNMGPIFNSKHDYQNNNNNNKKKEYGKKDIQQTKFDTHPKIQIFFPLILAGCENHFKSFGISDLVGSLFKYFPTHPL